MMMTPYNLMEIGCDANQGDSHQRRFSQIKAPRAVCPIKSAQPGFLLVWRQITPILLFNRHLDGGAHNLQRFGQVFPPEFSPQNRMASDYFLPSGFEGRD